VRVKVPRPRGGRGPWCGTYAAYSQHLYYGEVPCTKCRKANRKYHIEYEASKKKALAEAQEGT
jgi:hypothetical protein